MLIFKFFVGLAAAFAVLINASPFPDPEGEGAWQTVNITNSLNSRNILGYDPSLEWHDYCTVQVWMGKDSVNVGDKIGSSLYGTIWQTLDFMCPSNSHNNECHARPSETFFSKCAAGSATNVQDCTIVLKELYMHWETDQIRKLIIGAAAGALEAATAHGTEDGSNCYDMPGHGKGCNVGNAVRVNMPNIPKKTGWESRNRLELRLTNSNTFGKYNCCAPGNLRNIDSKTDGLGDEILQAFPQWKGKFTRDSRCIINGWQAC